MKKFTKKVKGSISLFMSMILLLLIILEGFLIDGSKVLAAKSLMSNAGDLSMNAGLTYYDEALRDIYGLFAISATEADLKENLAIHFKKTLGESAGDVDSQYVDQLLGYIEESLQGGMGDQEIGRLLNMQLTELTVSKPQETALSKPYVMKKGILEYMKYRGPVSLGYGIMEKLHILKDLDKQQETLEKKLDYEEKMSDIQEACQKAYDNIKPYNELLAGSLAPDRIEEASNDINKNIKEITVAVWCYSAAMRDFSLSKGWKTKNEFRGTDVSSCADQCRELDSLVQWKERAVNDLSGDFSSHPQGTMEAIKTTLGYCHEFRQYQNLYTAWQNYIVDYEERREALEEELENLDEDEDDSSILDELDDLEEEYETNREIYEEAEEKIDQLPGIIEEAREVLKNDIDNRIIYTAAKVIDIENSAKELKNYSIEGIKALDRIVEEMKLLKEKGEEWNSAIDKLSPGDVKTSMKTDYKNKAKDLDLDKIQELREKVGNGGDYATGLHLAAENTKAVGMVFYLEGTELNSKNLWFFFQTSNYVNDTIIEKSDYSEFSPESWTKSAHQSQIHSDENYTGYFIGTFNETMKNGILQVDLSILKQNFDFVSAVNDEFYKYLERVCGGKEKETDQKKTAKEAKKKIFNQGKSFSTNIEDSLPVLPKPDEGTDSSDKGSFTATDAGKSDKDISANAKNNTKSTVNFLKGVEQLLKDGRDKLYISEYTMEMFSCYTAKDGDSSLSSYPFNASNNYMYRAEAEYVLWGNLDGKKDVSYTMATIFGVRFLLNSLYAFTGDPEIRQVSLAMATAIAGWTGFGVPLVQSVIILGFALAETACDMMALKKGESVPIYKSESTWVIKPSGFSEDAINKALGKTVDTNKQYLFNHMNELTEETKNTFKVELDKYTKSVVKDISSVAVSAVIAPVQERMIVVVNVVSPSKEEVGKRVREAVESVEASINSEEDCLVKQAKKKAVEIFKSQYEADFVNMVNSIQNSSYSNEEISNTINTKLEEIVKQMQAKLGVFVTPLVNEAAGAVSDALDSGNEELQKKTSEAVDQMMVKINGGIGEADRNFPDGEKGKTAASAALTMNYKEYVSVFIAIKSVANEEEILRRIGHLIEANLALSNTKPSENFKIKDTSTMIELKARADLQTTFFAIPIPGSSGSGQDSYSISYHGVLGY